MNKIIFFRESLKNWRQIGSVTPSSRFLTDKVLSRIDFDNARLIVELGPGTGPITRKILERMHPECKLIVLELNETFCDVLRKLYDPRLVVRNISAQNLSEVLKGESTDYIISGLPFSVIGKEGAKQILGEVKKNLKPNGIFIKYQFSLVSLQWMKDIFGEVETGFVPMNFPPLFVFHASQQSRTRGLSSFAQIKVRKQRFLEQLSKSKIHGRIKKIAAKTKADS